MERLQEKDLSQPTKTGLDLIEKMNALLSYLYTGNTYKHKGYNYRMDGDFNPYIVSVGEDGQPRERGSETFPLFQNEHFWNLLVDMVHAMSDEKYKEIKNSNALTSTINLEQRGSL